MRSYPSTGRGTRSIGKSGHPARKNSLAILILPPVNFVTSSIVARLRQQRLTFLVMGVLVVAMQLWAALGVMPKANAQGIDVGQICTAKGLIAIQLPYTIASDNTPSNDTHADHECCTFCGTTTPPLFVSGFETFSQALTFVALKWSGTGVALQHGRFRSPPSHAPPHF